MAELDYSIIKSIEDLKNGKQDGLIHSADLTTQQEIDEAYNALIEQSWDALGAEVYTEYPKIKGRMTYKVREDFINSVVDTDKFQEKNILITAEMWQDLMRTPKQIINMGMFQRSATQKETKSEDIRMYNFSFLSKGKICNTNTNGLFLTTIQFELPTKKSIIASGVMKTTISEFENLMQAGDHTALYMLCNLAEKTSNFSIHQYYLQRGLEKGCANSAILLTRYDHCSATHKNDVLPRMYEDYLYKKYTTLPHFHFNSSFGNIYKLNSKQLSYNNGVGYAVSVDTLSKYLTKLMEAKPGDVFAENNFGMPFLGKNKKSLEKFEYKLNKLSKAIKEKDHKKEVRLALDVVLNMSNIKVDIENHREMQNRDEKSLWLR